MQQPQSGRRARSRALRPLGALPLLAALLFVVSPWPSATSTAASAHGVRPGALPVSSRLQVRVCSRKPLIVCGSFVVPLDHTDPALGSVRLFFERYLHSDTAVPALEPIVAVEGGPGYATTGSASLYSALFAPLMGRHDLLLMDLPGTGRSDAIDCPALQRGSGTVAQVGACGAQLGPGANYWGTAGAAYDLSQLLDALGIDKIDLYGDSYGTFFVQTFAVHYGARLRTIVMDSAYPAYGEDLWGRDTNVALDDAFHLACRRSGSCMALGGNIMARLKSLAVRLAADPVRGVGYDADGHPRHVVADLAAVLDLMTAAPTNLDVYRELDAAGRALVDDHDALPLLRLVAEEVPLYANGPYREFSAGLYAATACRDYPWPYDMTQPSRDRLPEYRRAVSLLQQDDPTAFAPFSVSEWISSDVEAFNYCLDWPARPAIDPPVPADARYPDVPTLALAGQLDSLTSPAGARIVASRFPRSTLVELANSGHVNALGDLYGCASAIVVRFIATESAGDTSCASRIPAIRMVSGFAAEVADAAPASPLGPSDRSTPYERKIAAVAAETVADALARWPNMTGTHGVGLRGGRFVVKGSPLVRFVFYGDRWTGNLPVSGRASWNQTTGLVSAAVRVPQGSLVMSWSNDATGGQATITGELGGAPISLAMPAP